MAAPAARSAVSRPAVATAGQTDIALASRISAPMYRQGVPLNADRKHIRSAREDGPARHRIDVLPQPAL
jgi:hypothetical protein